MVSKITRVSVFVLMVLGYCSLIVFLIFHLINISGDNYTITNTTENSLDIVVKRIPVSVYLYDSDGNLINKVTIQLKPYGGSAI